MNLFVIICLSWHSQFHQLKGIPRKPAIAKDADGQGVAALMQVGGSQIELDRGGKRPMSRIGPLNPQAYRGRVCSIVRPLIAICTTVGAVSAWSAVWIRKRAGRLPWPPSQLNSNRAVLAPDSR